jgi:hypothetical protein
VQGSDDGFDFKAMEPAETATNFDRISSDLKSAIGQVDSTAELNAALKDLSDKVGQAGSSMQQTEQGVTGMFASAGDADATTSDRQLQSFVVEFDRPIDPVPVTMAEYGLLL